MSCFLCGAADASKRIFDPGTGEDVAVCVPCHDAFMPRSAEENFGEFVFRDRVAVSGEPVKTKFTSPIAGITPTPPKLL